MQVIAYRSYIGKLQVHVSCQLLRARYRINRCSVHGMTLTDHFIGLNNCKDCSVNCVIAILGIAKCLHSVY